MIMQTIHRHLLLVWLVGQTVHLFAADGLKAADSRLPSDGKSRDESSRRALPRDFVSPPADARPWVYWWWLNGNASRAGITRDFEEMKKHGIGGALLFDAGEAGPEVPRGPKFMSADWRELFKYAVREADRCGLVLTVNLCSGWNCGGPWVTPELAEKKVVSAQTVVSGPGQVSLTLPQPPVVQGFYRDLAVLAQPAPTNSATGKKSPPLVWQRSEALDLTRFMDQNGKLEWHAPEGSWTILRIGSTLTGHLISNPGSGPSGLEIDPLSAEAMDAHFAATGAKLIADAGPQAGKTLQYFHIDSWEIGQPTWTPRMREEFQQRRGYDLLPWLPAVLGMTVDNADGTRRFLQDYRRTFTDLVAANYYGRLRDLTVRGGLRGIHAESGGPNQAHHFWADALQYEGLNEIPMGEFWARNGEPGGDIFYGPHNFTIKESAAAAHIYGKPLCQAEAFTSLADDFIESPWSLKDLGDAAFCDGLTRLVFHNWPTQLQPELQPGYWWPHIGTHFGYHLTWWPMADGWLAYLARCQHLLRQGLFVADFAFLQSEAIPAFTPRRSDQKPARPAGFDYDPINSEVLLTRATAQGARLRLPDGMNYRYLVLPHEPDALLSPATLNKVNELAAAGVTVIGATNFAAAVEKLRVASLDAVVRADGLAPDLEFLDSAQGADFDWIHRRDGQREIYFISHQGSLEATANIVFRVAGKQPELWDAVTGGMRDLSEWREANGRIRLPMRFAPRQSFFVVFQKPAVAPGAKKNFPKTSPVQEIAGPWRVQFDPQWFYPTNDLRGGAAQGELQFAKLEDWIARPEPAVKNFSGTAVYRQTFDLREGRPQNPVYLDLGEVKNLARVRLNGQDLGVLWTAPWRVDITSAVKPRANRLEIAVVNLWPNRLIGDASLPPEQRRTVSNISTYDSVLTKNQLLGSSWAQSTCPTCTQRLKTGEPAKLLSSGLLGPVTIQQIESPTAP